MERPPLRVVSKLPDGMEDLGPSQDLAQNHPNLLGANGQPMKDVTPNIKEPPVVWIKDEELSESQGEDFWFPKLEIEGIAAELSGSRNHKLFYPGERQMFINLFAMHISKYLFGVECVQLKETEEDVVFVANPEFDKLPVYDIEKK